MGAIGIEIGGTKLQVGIGAAGGNLTSVVRREVDRSRGREGICALLPEMVDEALTAAMCRLDAIAGIGIGFGGLVDTRTGVTKHSFQIGGWDEFPLRAWAQAQWGRPVAVQNDAKTAGLGEATFGAGRGYRRVLYITIGSGIGGGWIVDGRIDEGQGLGATEIGHMWVPEPGSGAPAELELICSGWSIAAHAQAAAQSEPSILAGLAGSQDRIDAKVVYAAAARGDAVANRILAETCTTLGIGIGNVVTLCHPECIIIGGGVSLMGDLFWEPLQAQIRRWSLPAFADQVRIVKAALGEQVVVIGAVALGHGLAGAQPLG